MESRGYQVHRLERANLLRVKVVKTEEGARIKQMLQLVLVCHATPVVLAGNEH